MEDKKQIEIDAFFNAIDIPGPLRGVLGFFKVDLDSSYDKLRKSMILFMDDEGVLNGTKLREAAEAFEPRIAFLIPRGMYRPTEKWGQVKQVGKQIKDTVTSIVEIFI